MIQDAKDPISHCEGRFLKNVKKGSIYRVV